MREDTHGRRSARDWIVDVAMFLLAARQARARERMALLSERELDNRVQIALLVHDATGGRR